METKDNSLIKFDMEEYIDDNTKIIETVEFEILPAVNINEVKKDGFYREINDIDKRLNAISERVSQLNSEIDTLTNNADGLDYVVAVISGIIAGIVDSFFVGEWNFENAKSISNENVNNKVIEFVKKDPEYIPWCNKASHGRNLRDPNRLASAIEFLEEKFPLPGDGAYMSENCGISGKTHRLDDFCHHPTLIGMLCCVIVQFTKKTVYSHNAGAVIKIPISIDKSGEFVGNSPITKVMAGVVNWFFNCAKAISNQKGHLMSDMATSAGVPGSLMSLLKELSALPCFKNTNFGENLRKAYQNGIGNNASQLDLGIFNKLFEGASSKLDSRTEDAFRHELKRQAVPVILNEALVRSFYFIRRFIKEMKNKVSLSEIEWKNVLPFKNRTVVRMMTVSTSTFFAFDVIDSAIRSGGFNGACILRINFVGVGRFAIAVGTDAFMGIKKIKKENELTRLKNEQLHLLNAKIFYKQGDMWREAENTDVAIKAVCEYMNNAMEKFGEYCCEIESGAENRKLYIDSIKKNYNEFANEILQQLEWGL